MTTKVYNVLLEFYVEECDPQFGFYVCRVRNDKVTNECASGATFSECVKKLMEATE